MIDRAQRETVWERDNIFDQSSTVALVATDNNRLGFYSSSMEPSLTQDQFFEMIRAGAAHFGKELEIKDMIKPCPVCGSSCFRYAKCDGVSSGDPVTFYAKECRVCGLTGPRGTNKRSADEKWDRVFNQDGDK